MVHRLAFAALLVTACAVPPWEPEDYVAASLSELEPVTWRLLVASSTPAAMREAAVDAARAWERAVAGTCPIRFELEEGPATDVPPEGDRTISLRSATDEELPRELGWTEWFADGSGRGSRVLVRTSAGSAMPITIRHELGHAMWITHHDEQGAGAVSLPPAPALTIVDVRAFAALHCAR